MNIKYIGMDVHKETISIAVMNGEGKVVMESIIETKASTILQCIQGVHGDLHVTFEKHGAMLTTLIDARARSDSRLQAFRLYFLRAEMNLRTFL